MKKIQSLVLALALLGTVVTSVIHVGASAPNLIANPSVETGSSQPANWQPDHWGKNTASLTYVNVGHTGSRSLYTAVSNYQSGDAKWIMDPVAVNPSTVYTYSDYYKSNVATELDAAYTDATGTTTYAYLKTVAANANWTAVTSQFTTPANVSRVAIYHLVASNGWLQTDDFSLTGPAPVQSSDGDMFSANPADYTPQLPLGQNSPGSGSATYAFAQVGDTMYSGGSFAKMNGLNRQNIAAFSATTGTMSSFAPQVNGAVWAIVPLANGQIAIGGEFTTVNGVARRGMAVIDPTTGQVNTAFNANLNGAVYDAKLVNGQLILGGSFGKKLMAVNPTTGADLSSINLNIAGQRVYRFAVNSQGTRLVAIGKIDTVSGVARRQAFMVNLSTTASTLSSWYYQPLMKQCSIPEDDAYLRGVSFSPDGSFFVVDGTGYVSNDGDLGITICDAAARFETATLNPSRPTWINYTGGDTLHSVIVTDNAVYVGGHNRWLDNPQGSDTCGPGCVPRPGIGAIDPTTGRALPWNPMRTRGVGAKVLYITPAGLWVGSDTDFGGKLGCSNPSGPNQDDCTGKPLENHAGIGFLPIR
jgi:hypothetical protein